MLHVLTLANRGKHHSRNLVESGHIDEVDLAIFLSCGEPWTRKCPHRVPVARPNYTQNHESWPRSAAYQ